LHKQRWLIGEARRNYLVGASSGKASACRRTPVTIGRTSDEATLLGENLQKNQWNFGKASVHRSCDAQTLGSGLPNL